MEKQKISKGKLAAGVILFLGAVLLLWGIYDHFKPQTQEGKKEITIKVIDDKKQVKEYRVRTDADYLQGAMDDAEGLTYAGEEGPYGLMVDTVNGVRAIYDKDGAYWGFQVNGVDCSHGISEEPVKDKDEFQIVYTPS